MKNHIMGKRITTILAATLILLSLMACERRAYQKAKTEDTVEAYNKFLGKYPNSEYTEEITYEKVMLEGYLSGLKNYLRMYGSSSTFRSESVRQAIIKRLKDEPYWSIREVQTINDPILRSNIDTMLWGHEKYAYRLALEKNDMSTFAKYCDLYPDGEHIKIIRRKEDSLATELYNKLIDRAINSHTRGNNAMHVGTQQTVVTPPVLNPDYSDPNLSTSCVSIENNSFYPCIAYLRSKSGKIQTMRLAARSVGANEGPVGKMTIANGVYDLAVVGDGTDDLGAWACRLIAKGSYYTITLQADKVSSRGMPGATEIQSELNVFNGQFY